MFLYPEVIEVFLRGMQMNKCIFNNYIFPYQEFMVLSALTGLDKLNILMDKKKEELNQKSVNQILFQLYQKEIICWKAEKLYELNPKIRSLFLNIKESKRELQIYGKNQKSPFLCYLGKEFVVTELSENDRNAIKIHGISQQNFIKELQDRGFIPVENENADFDMEESLIQGIEEEFWVKNLLKSMEKTNFQMNQFPQIMEEEEHVQTTFSIYDKKKKWEKQDVFLLDCGIKDCIMFRENGTVRFAGYSAEKLKDILRI